MYVLKGNLNNRLLTVPNDMSTFRKILLAQAVSSSGGGGTVSWSLVTSTSSQGTGSNDNTTSILDTTGANLIAMCVGYGGGSAPTPSDSKGNTWSTALASTFGGGNPKMIWFYCINPSVGSGHTFTVPAISSNYCNIQVFAFTKSGGTPVLHTGLDGEVITGNWGSSSGVQPGSITPATADSLFLSSVIYDVNVSGMAVTSSFIMPNSQLTVPFGLQAAYKIKVSSSTAEDPTWTVSSGGADAYAAMIDFN